MRVPRPNRILMVRLIPPYIWITRVLLVRWRWLSPDAGVVATFCLFFLVVHKSLDHLRMLLVMLRRRLGIRSQVLSLRCGHHRRRRHGIILVRSEIHSRALVKLRLPRYPGGVWLLHIRWRPSIESGWLGNVLVRHRWRRRVSVRWDLIV